MDSERESQSETERHKKPADLKIKKLAPTVPTFG